MQCGPTRLYGGGGGWRDFVVYAFPLQMNLSNSDASETVVQRRKVSLVDVLVHDASPGISLPEMIVRDRDLSVSSTLKPLTERGSTKVLFQIRLYFFCVVLFCRCRSHFA